MDTGSSVAAVSEYWALDNGRGRIATRRCVGGDMRADPQFEPGLWPGLRSIAMIESVREGGPRVALV